MDAPSFPYELRLKPFYRPALSKSTENGSLHKNTAGTRKPAVFYGKPGNPAGKRQPAQRCSRQDSPQTAITKSSAQRMFIIKPSRMKSVFTSMFFAAIIIISKKQEQEIEMPTNTIRITPK